jgi:transcriptional regulator with XRE-family HTH domain
MEVISVLADKIKLLRKSQGLSQTDFAKRLFVTPGAVNQWERGKTSPDTARLISIAREFQVPLDFFSDDKPDTTETELIKQHLLIELGADKPKTDEARILAAGVDRLPKPQREQALDVVKAMFREHSDYFKG